MKLTHLISISIILVFLVACRKDKPPQRPDSNVTLGTSGGVFVLNEGNFMFGNAKVGFYNKTDHSSIVDLYAETNGGSIGDVLQSMYILNEKAYLVVNNSGKIEVCDPLDLQKFASISGFTSPRYILPVSNSKAYVSDLYADKVWIVDLTNNTISGYIPLEGWCEQMTAVFGEVYITNYEKGKVYVIDAATDVLTDSINLSIGVSNITEDANGKLWVLSGGDAVTSTAPYLYKINPLTKNIESSFLLTGSPGRLCKNGTADTLFYLNGGAYRMPINATAVPSSAFISGSGHTYYALGIDPENSEVYLGDAIDYIQAGKTFIYNPQGIYLREFDTGIIPGEFYFK